MLWGGEKRLCILYPLTPLCAGSGQALGAVDLPIQRERHTAWPMIQASGIKGSMRDWCENAWNDKGTAESIFGKSGETGSNWAGAITVTDARILFFPVRSNVSPFVHVTCPAVLRRLSEDLELLGYNPLPGVPQLSNSDESLALIESMPAQVILEDIVTNVKNNTRLDSLKNFVKNYVPSVKKALIVSDDIFGYLVRTATEVQAHIAIDDASGTTKDGSLRYQEYLPSDSVLYFLAFFSDVRASGVNIKAKDVASKVTMDGVCSHIQIGGDFTLGKGICKVQWVNGGSKQ
ncbi:MAG: type III-B CRISPR module RAMP protein Cmr4 [Thermodesulforhabdaceae bacterium]